MIENKYRCLLPEGSSNKCTINFLKEGKQSTLI
jgi:hypothetical protein